MLLEGCLTLLLSLAPAGGSVWKMSGTLDWTPWMKKRRARVLCALGAVLLCCLQSGATVSGQSTVTVSDEIPVFTQEPLSVVQKLGGSVTLRCTALPSSANISWRLNGQELAGGAGGELGVVVAPGALLIPALTNLTLGRYQCVASTGAGALASVPANVTAAKLRDFEPDDQLVIEVDEGNTAVIECHLPESQPKAQVRYSVKQEWLETSKGNYLIMPSGNLQIANATLEDEGLYKCAAYNPVTQEVKTSTSTDRLRVRRSTSEAARIIYPPASRSIMVTRGQRLVLECVASGTPTPQVTWAKDGQDLRFHNNTRFLLSNLLIDAAGEGDSGMYACHANNGVGSANTATALYDVQVFEPPQVVVELLQQEVAWGESVRFSCQARGKPAPSVVWLHNARPLAPSPRHRLSARVLRVLNVGPQDDGLYQCLAENGLGSSQAAARLLTVPTVVPPRPGKLPILRPLSPDKVLREQAPVRPGGTGILLPQDCSELHGHISPAEAPVILSQPRTVKSDFYELTWKPRHDGGSPVQEYIVKYRKTGDPPGEWATSSIPGSLHKLTLAKLHPASLYEVEMAAKNCAGLGQPAMMTFRTGKGRRSPGPNEPPKTPPVPSPRLSPPEAPDKPTISTASETSAYVTWIPRGNRGFPIQSFRVEYKKKGAEWEVAVANIPPSRLSVEISSLEKGTSYKFRVVAVNVIGASPPSAPSKLYTVVGSGRTNERPIDGPYITYNEAINETTIILKWTYTPHNNTPIYGFYIFYRPTDSDNDSDYKKDVVEGDRYWHSITDLQPETAYDIKMQCFNEGGESEFGNVVILETKARSNQPSPPSEVPSLRPVQPGGPVPRPSDLPYLIVGVVLGVLVFIIVAFIPFCLWRAWAKQKQTSDLCFPAVASPVSSCQYTMVPLQGLALVKQCPLDPHLAHQHAVYPPNGEYTPNGKPYHPTHCLPGLHQEDMECGLECDTLLPQTLSNGHTPGYHYSNSCPEHHGEVCCLPDDSTLQLLNTSHRPISCLELEEDAHFYSNNVPHANEIARDAPYIIYSEAINETTIILKWTYTPQNNTPIYGFYIFYRPTDSDNDSDYKKDVVEGDRYWHSITDLQPETAYDIKMQCFNEGGESEFGNVVILETKGLPCCPLLVLEEEDRSTSTTTVTTPLSQDAPLQEVDSLQS
ncbi:brother of CDO isoform X2 [Hypomesus transpacificus]|uniref:brother of CDO isoform X2 n=1 Tax=Hypomesus transpacificus TaxID=137520 RepID=UPI001F08073D|nr:brother of CDO isoform X2 [Hypomesus transpacificus]